MNTLRTHLVLMMVLGWALSFTACESAQEPTDVHQEEPAVSALNDTLWLPPLSALPSFRRLFP